MDTKQKYEKVQLKARLLGQELSLFITFIIPIVKVRIAVAGFLLTLNCAHNALQI